MYCISLSFISFNLWLNVLFMSLAPYLISMEMLRWVYSFRSFLRHLFRNVAWVCEERVGGRACDECQYRLTIFNPILCARIVFCLTDVNNFDFKFTLSIFSCWSQKYSDFTFNGAYNWSHRRHNKEWAHCHSMNERNFSHKRRIWILGNRKIYKKWKWERDVLW